LQNRLKIIFIMKILIFTKTLY